MKPSLQDVVREKGIQEFKQTKRSVRLEKKNGMFEVRPWDPKRGHDWNPLKGYLDKRQLVKEFEKRIDIDLGKKGEGKKLTKAVGAYSRSFFTKWLPKMNMEQIEQLKFRVDAATVLAGFQKAGSDSRPVFSKKFILDDDQRKAVEGDLRRTFGERCVNNIKEGLGSDPHYKVDGNRTNVTLTKNNMNLRSLDSHDERMIELERLAGNKETARDLTVFLVQDAIGSVNVVVSSQNGFDVQDLGKTNTLNCNVTLERGIYTFEYSSARQITLFADLEGTQVYMSEVDHDFSCFNAELTITIPEEDVKARRFNRLEVVKASIAYVLRPKTGAESPAQIEMI
jgi:hypothetical protein